ncbi:hypothetical protein AB6N24_06375 [Cellulomonas sp. 179-A 4D5 NHS]|uniref:hypothetical protein n=1 Tax=Cellulomonas sp. 179-A 4D5 NHS TaxID=3142378 RepID=UPI0039A399A8
MANFVDPLRDIGRWLVTTASGAQHLIDSTDRDQAVTVTRLVRAPAAPTSAFWLQKLRRDERPVRVIEVAHADQGTMRDGIVVGGDMFLTLEPLDPDAAVTYRRTTPVVSIELQPLDGPGRDDG